jgi:hypothetical protein
MKWRIAAFIAALGIGGIPAVADAVQAQPAAMHVTVKPGTGSPRSHFAVSFRAGAQTATGSLVRSYQVTASAAKRTGCLSSASATAPAEAKGVMEHVTLSPGNRPAWCTGTYHGQVSLYQTERCGPPAAALICPQVEIRPQVVGRFTFRVTRG